MIKLVDARDFLYTAADFWLYAGEVVVATIKVNPRHTPHEYQKRRKDWGVAIAAALPYEQSGSDTTWAGERQLGIPATAVWLTKMGCDPQPFLTLAAERGWDSEIITEATEAVEKEKARLVPPVDYLVIFLQGGIVGDHVYLPFNEVVKAMQSHCDAELRWAPDNGDTISLSDGEGYKDALAYPLYPPYSYSDELVPREKAAKLTRSWCDGNNPERVKADVTLDNSGVTITVEADSSGVAAEVLVEFYDGAVTARVWDAEGYGGDPDYGDNPTVSVELFKTGEVQHG
ncbi:MAG: hypothetical protein RBU21_19350 [FCB group bacterium]|jgi:hypothetical protein|nr:hypothetical protein [FCB group bacterium]